VPIRLTVFAHAEIWTNVPGFEGVLAMPKRRSTDALQNAGANGAGNYGHVMECGVAAPLFTAGRMPARID
jgi:hypothetical protein